jgi:flagellar motor switch protein FliM
LMFNRSTTDYVDLRCGGVTLCNGLMGRSRSNIAVQINQLAERMQR